MPESQVAAETKVSEIVEANKSFETERPNGGKITVVTPENFDAYVSDKHPSKPVEVEADGEQGGNENVESVSEKDAENKEAKPKEGDVDGAKVYFKGKWVSKHDFGYRLHVQTKASEEKAKKASQEAKAAREAKSKAEDDVAALRAKYEAPKTDDLGPEPQPSQFTDINEYKKAIKDWTAESTRREDAQKLADERQTKEREAVAKAWGERQTAVKAKLPDYESVIAASDVKVSDQVRDAIVESEFGPNILYHLAQNPDVADTLGKMTVSKALREIGRLEAKLSDTKEDKVESRSAVAEISRAPAPISPLRGANAPVTNKVDSNGEFYGTYDEFKKLRQSGKIK